MNPPKAVDKERWWTPLALAVALGTTAGLAQVAAILYRRHVAHVFTWTSRDISWMSPLANVATLLLVVAATTLLRFITPRHGPRLQVIIVSWFAAVSVLLNVKGLHPIATVVLAVGLAIQVGRVFASHEQRWGPWVARIAVGGVLLAVLAAMLSGRKQGNVAEGTAPAGAPSVVLLILDTVRAASTSLHGYARATTPALEQLAADGLRYEWAIAPSAWTLPSHASMFTGRAASTLSTSWRSPLDGAHPTVAEALARHGYATGAFVANPFYTHHESGVDRGFAVLRDFRRSVKQVMWSTTFTQTPLVIDILWGQRTPGAVFAALRRFDLRARSEPLNDRRRAAEVVDEFLDWQSGVNRPFFAFLNLYDAHDPYVAAPGYESTFSKSPTKQDTYDAGIKYMDDQVARLLRVLGERGVLDKTLVVVTSDHGEQWGEHGLMNHGNSLYLPVVHVPLVMRLPARARAGERVDPPASLTDLAATILDATGIVDRRIPGRSLLAPEASVVVTETEALDPSARAKAPAEKGALASIVQDSLQYIRNGDGTYQLFNIRRDYAQAVDLVTSPVWCGVAVRLDSILRGVSREPATPAFTSEQCGARAVGQPTP